VKGLKPEVSIPIALAVGTLVWTIYNRGLPPNVDVRAGGHSDEKVESVRKQNAWMAASTVAAISLIARDPNIFIVGGAMTVAADWAVRINNMTNPVTNTLESAYERTRVTRPTAVPNPTATPVASEYQAVV
jgi:hypothetical protein